MSTAQERVPWDSQWVIADGNELPGQCNGFLRRVVRLVEQNRPSLRFPQLFAQFRSILCFHYNQVNSIFVQHIPPAGIAPAHNAEFRPKILVKQVHVRE